jgi:hypothetical protein
MSTLLRSALAHQQRENTPPPTSMKPLRAAFEQFREAVEVMRGRQEMVAYKGSLESLQGMGASLESAHGDAFTGLVMEKAAQGGFHTDTPPTDLNTSMEFLGKLIDKVKTAIAGTHKHVKPGAKHDVNVRNQWQDEFKKAQTQLEKSIKDYYLNEKWLANQQFVEGDVKADDISPRLQYKGVVREDIVKAFDESSKAYDAMWNKFRPGCASYIKDIIAIDNELLKKGNPLKTIEEVDPLVKEAIAKCEALKTPTERSNMVGEVYTFLGPVTITFGKDRVTQKSEKTAKPVATFKALDKEGVKSIASLIMKIVTDGWDGDEPSIGWGVDHSDGEPLRKWYDDSSYLDEYYDHVSGHSIDDYWMYEANAMYQLYDLIPALEHWIDRSIK